MTENPRIRIYANRWFAKFAAKEKISDATIADAVHRVGVKHQEVGALAGREQSGVDPQHLGRRAGRRDDGVAR